MLSKARRSHPCPCRAGGANQRSLSLLRVECIGQKGRVRTLQLKGWVGPMFLPSLREAEMLGRMVRVGYTRRWTREAWSSRHTDLEARSAWSCPLRALADGRERQSCRKRGFSPGVLLCGLVPLPVSLCFGCAGWKALGKKTSLEEPPQQVPAAHQGKSYGAGPAIRRGDGSATRCVELGQQEGSSSNDGRQQSPGLLFLGEQPCALREAGLGQRGARFMMLAGRKSSRRCMTLEG